MESPNRAYIPEVDQLRGFAALLVFFYHTVHAAIVAQGYTAWPVASSALTALIYEGHSGVTLFMVLSGYILSKGTFHKQVSYRRFIRNRVLRIFPLMFLVFALAIYASDVNNLGSALAPFLLLINTAIAFHDPSGLSGTLWTASVEFQFYLVAPYLFAIVAKRGIWGFVVPFCALFIAMRLILLAPIWNDPKRIFDLYHVTYFTIIGRGTQFLGGVSLAYLIDRKYLSMSRFVATIVLGCGAICVLSLLWIVNHQGGIAAWRSWHVVLPEIEAGSWTIFLCGYLGSRPLGSSTLGRILRAIGVISFSIYVLHYSIESEWWTIAYPKMFGGMHMSAYALASMVWGLLAVVLALAWLSYICIERPFMEMRVRYVD